MSDRPFELRALDGTNPLGFLAALGALVTLTRRGVTGARLRWRQARTWVPVLEGAGAADERALAEAVTEGLLGDPVADDAERVRERAQQAMKEARKAVERKREEISRRRLGRSERAETERRELRPLEQEYEARRREWLEALRRAVPRPELAIGVRIECTPEEYREHAAGFLAAAGQPEREALDMLAAFGSDACRRRNSDTIDPTPFCFASGSGHQNFLDTVRQLIDRVTAARVYETLFEPWSYRDERLSLRWDPVEDRRYALLDRDPSDDGARTVWMANLLAYRALALFPTAPTGRRLAATGWLEEDEERRRRRWFTWPLWDSPVGLDVVRSLLGVRELSDRRPDCDVLGARGIVAVYRAERIEVGLPPNYKLNFSPARALCSRWR
jgi:hypothetical protein